MALTASSVRPEAGTSLGTGSGVAGAFGFGFDLRIMWALAPPKPKELTPTSPPCHGQFLCTTYESKQKYDNLYSTNHEKLINWMHSNPKGKI